MGITLTPPRERERQGTGSGTGDAWRVIVLNDDHNTFDGGALPLPPTIPGLDDHNTFDGVALALASTIPGIDYDKGMALATKIDSTGQAVVWSGAQELAEHYHAELDAKGPTMAPLAPSRLWAHHT